MNYHFQSRQYGSADWNNYPDATFPLIVGYPHRIALELEEKFPDRDWRIVDAHGVIYSVRAPAAA